MRSFTFAVLAALSCASSPSIAADTPPAAPADLRDCYLKVAAQKSVPDAMFIAREICDALFKKSEPSSIVSLDPKSNKCVELWFDADGRYESGDMYCAFEARSDNRYVYACESKDPKVSRFTYQELLRKDGRYERTSKSAGADPGLFFASLTTCLEHKAGLSGSK